MRPLAIGVLGGFRVACGGPQYDVLDIPARSRVACLSALRVRVRTRPAGLRWAVGVETR